MLKLQIHCHFKRNWLSCFPICPDLGFSLVRGLGEGMFKIKKKIIQVSVHVLYKDIHMYVHFKFGV